MFFLPVNKEFTLKQEIKMFEYKCISYIYVLVDWNLTCQTLGTETPAKFACYYFYTSIFQLKSFKEGNAS